jgi:hypothetical protein
VPTYDYRCDTCRAPFSDFGTHDQSQEFVGAPCPHLMDQTDVGANDSYRTSTGCKGHLRRVFSFHLTPVMHEHYNPSLGTTVHDMADYRRKLKQASEEAEIRTGGVKHDFQPISPAEIRATMTDEGLQSTHDRQVELGLREPTKKVI